MVRIVIARTCAALSSAAMLEGRLPLLYLVYLPVGVCESRWHSAPGRTKPRSDAFGWWRLLLTHRPSQSSRDASLHAGRTTQGALEAGWRIAREQASSVTRRTWFSSMSCVYFLSDVFWVFHTHRCLDFDLAAGCYSGELASVKILLDNLLPNLGVLLVVVCFCVVGWLFFFQLLLVFISLKTFTDL